MEKPWDDDREGSERIEDRGIRLLVVGSHREPTAMNPVHFQ